MDSPSNYETRCFFGQKEFLKSKTLSKPILLQNYRNNN